MISLGKFHQQNLKNASLNVGDGENCFNLKVTEKDIHESQSIKNNIAKNRNSFGIKNTKTLIKYLQKCYFISGKQKAKDDAFTHSDLHDARNA